MWLATGVTYPILSYPHTHTGDLRQTLYKDVDSFVDALRGHDFLGGSTPNLADLSAYGVLKAVQGTPTYNDVVVNTKVRGPRRGRIG